MLRKWYHKLFVNQKNTQAKTRVRRTRLQLRLEALEDRVVPASFTVTSTLDDGSAGTLRAAIAQANASSDATNTISFTLGAGAHTIVLSPTQGPLGLDNSHSTTIMGTGADQLFISGNHATGVFSISTGTTVELDNLTIEDGSSDIGGGIYNSGNLTINNSTLSGNTAQDAGGIFNYTSSTVTINNSTLADNTASGIGGGIYNYFATATINNSTLYNNTANYGAGGGIYNQHDATAAINNSTLADNTANFYGGGICNYDNVTVTINNSTLADNTASYSGGGIYNDFSTTVSINNSTLADNTATDFSGGGIYNYDSATATNNSTLSGNTARGGGGIFNDYNATATINNSTLADNTASGVGTGVGGGIYNADSATVTINNSTLADNTASGVGGGIGGGILNASATATINNSTLADNTANSGGGIYNVSATANLGNSIVAKNTASDAAPDVYGSFNSFGHNLIGIADESSGFTNDDLVGSLSNPLDPKLGSLADNGGPTQTMALLAGSPAINAGSNALIPDDPSTGQPYTTDQRGEARIFGSSVDIGAYEVQPKTFPTATVVTSSANPSSLNQPVTFTTTVSSSFGTPAGSVDFFDTTTHTDLGTFALSSSGTASVTVSNLALGANVIKATYAGQGLFRGSSNTVTQQVSYGFSFLPPLSNGLTFAVNRTIPIKFQLRDYNGKAITSLSAVTTLQIQALDAKGNPVGAPFTPASTNNQGLQYSGGQYLFNWQTKGLAASSYQIVLTLADGTTQTKTIQLTAGGSSAGLVTDGSGGTSTAGALLGGEVDLYVDNSNGDLTSDELARIQDAVTSIDVTIAPYGVVINAVSDPTQANVTLNMNMTSALGGAPQGVLGCTTDADQVTMIQGWNWYAGADATQIGSGQYDFETAVMHELGHVLGLGHSSNSTSVMYASLATGTANRVLTTADLNVPDDDSGPCALHAVPAATVSSTSNSPSMTASSSTSVPSSTSSVSSGNPMSAADQLFANFTLVLNDIGNAYQRKLSAVTPMWQSADAVAMQHLDALQSMEAGAMGMSKDTLMRDLLFAS